jgi:hypothetical protein
MDAERLGVGPVQTRIRLSCEGGYIGELINDRWLELPCKQQRCRQNGVQTVHRWDLLTGQRSTVYREVPARTIAAKVANSTAGE